MKGKSLGDVIVQSYGNFSRDWTDIVSSIVLFCVCVFGLILFPLFGLFLAYFAMGFLCVGQKKFVLGCVGNKKQPLETIFEAYKLCFKAFAMKTTIILFIILWGMIFVVPGIIYALNCSFTSFIMAENEQLSTFEVISKSKQMTFGYRTKIFLLCLFCFAMILAFASLGYGVTLLIALMATLPLWANIAIICAFAILGTVLLVWPFFEEFTAIVYLEAKSKAKTQTKVNSKTNSKHLTQKSA